MERKHRWVGIAAAVSAAVASTLLTAAAEESYGPGPEAFTPVARFIFRNEAEAIGRKVATTRSLAEPLDVIEVTLEAMPGAPGARGWTVVVVGKVPGGCHVVTVGISANEGKVHRVSDRRVLPPKPPLDCERWYVTGSTSETAASRTPVAMIETPAPTPERTSTPAATAMRTAVPTTPAPTPVRTVATATPTPTPLATGKTVPTAEASPTRTAFSSSVTATPTPTRVKRGRPPEKLTRDDVVLLATEFAVAEGITEVEPKLSDLTGGRWRQDVLGRTKKGKGCAAFKIELTAPDWAMRYQIETTRGKSIGECREWYVKEGRGELTDGWKPGKVDW